ncbi:MAG: VOC family protein [Alphaproteobacteria bacterium]|nr:VOC family protein [Alphaproteobacteria bacterium]
MLSNFHHVAFRCRNAAETTRFYTEVLGLKYSHAVLNEVVPSTGAKDPHLHIFFELEDGSSIAFFDVPKSPPAQPDPNTPEWVQHVAFQVRNMDELMESKARLESHNIDFIGPISHYPDQYSIYFFDPNGLRLEFNLPAPPGTDDKAGTALELLERWEKMRSAGHWEQGSAVSA